MAVERSKLRQLWVSHETARVVAQLYSRGAAPMSAEELLAAAAGLPGTQPTVEQNAARRFWSMALRLWQSRVSLGPTQTVPEITKALHELARQGMPPGDFALEAPLRAAALTGFSLPCVAAALPRGDDDHWGERFLVRLGREADEALERLIALERDFGRWHALLPKSRADSRIADALVLLGTTHALTPRYIGDALGLTRQASARLLRQLEGYGIVRKATERKRWLIYIAENVAGSIVPETTIEISRQDDIDVEAIDRVLADAYAALDRTVRRDGA